MITANEQTIKEVVGKTVVTVTMPGYFAADGMGEKQGQIIGITAKHPKFDFGQEFIVKTDDGELFTVSSLMNPETDKGIGAYLLQ